MANLIILYEMGMLFTIQIRFSMMCEHGRPLLIHSAHDLWFIWAQPLV